MKCNKLLSVIFCAVTFTGSGWAQHKLQSVSVLTFSPENNILFAADAKAGKIFAFATGNTSNPSSAEGYNVKDADKKIAALLGTTADKILVKDIAVHPGNHETYIAIERITGKTYTPAIVIMNQKGTVRRFDETKATATFVKIKNAPAKDFLFYDDRSAQAELTFTDIDFYKGKLYISGLSNTDFASTLRVVDYPFNSDQVIANIEIYHTNHDQVETRAPIRALEIVNLKGQDYLLAAYTCTPLVTIPLSDIRNGAHVTGKTIAELGYGNTPVDLISYTGQDFQQNKFPVVFLANKNQSAQLLPLAAIEEGNGKEGINSFAGFQKKGVAAYDLPVTVVLQVAPQDDNHLLLARRNTETGRVELMSVFKNLYFRVSDFESEYEFPDYKYGKNQDMFKNIQNMLKKDEGFTNKVVQ